jgi:hypothetical protein
MKNEFIPYEEALALKELGFDEECFGFYDDIDSEHELYQVHTQTWNETHRLNKQLTRAPLYQQAFRWFREKGIYGEPTSDLSNNLEDRVFVYSLYSETGGYFVDRSEEYNTYEEAELACLRKLIEIVNQNKEDK